MIGLNITITQLLSYLAAYECFLAGMLVCAFCFLTSIKHVASAKDEPRRLADRWRFVFTLRMFGLGAFATFTFENYVNQTLHKGADWFQAAVATAALAFFIGSEAFAARRVVQIVLRRGGRIGLTLCLALHFVLMCVLAHAALFAWSLFPQTGLPYFKLVLKWDPLYVLVAVFFSLLIAGVVGSFVRNRLRLSLGEYFAGAVSSFIICAYLLLIPLQARYLVLMLPGSDDGSLDFNAEYYASEARVEALRRLVPWMIGYKPLDGLKAAWWDSVTIRFETPGDPIYMEQLRRAARAGQRSSLERLWVKKPGEAREIAELLLAAAQSPMNLRHFVLGEGPAVLFLEDPDRELFKVLIPDEKRRTELHQLLLNWTEAEERELLACQPGIEKTSTCYLRLEAYYNLQHALFDDEKPHWLSYKGQEIPESLQPAAIDFITFTDIRRGYQLLGCPNQRIAVQALQDILKSAHWRERLDVDPWNRAAGVNMEEFLGNIHPNVAIACMQVLVKECSEEAVLNSWTFTAKRPWPHLVEHSDFILSHWNEIVPRATKMDGSGVSAQTAFISERLLDL